MKRKGRQGPNGSSKGAVYKDIIQNGAAIKLKSYRFVFRGVLALPRALYSARGNYVRLELPGFAMCFLVKFR